MSRVMQAAIVVEGISPSAKLVLLTLAFHADQDMQCNPGVNRQAAITGLSARTVRTALSELETTGIIERHAQEGTSNTYTLTLKGAAKSAGVNGGGGDAKSAGVPRGGDARIAAPRIGKSLSSTADSAGKLRLPSSSVVVPDSSLKPTIPPTAAPKPPQLRVVGGVEAVDARTVLFGHSLAIFRMMTGLPEQRSRSMLGKFCKAAGDDASMVNAVIAEAANLNPAEPVAWLTAAIQNRTNQAAQRRHATVTQDWRLGSMVSDADMAIVEEAMRG